MFKGSKPMTGKELEILNKKRKAFSEIFSTNVFDISC